MARARASTPAAPATPIAAPLVGAVAPPVDFADEADAEPEATLAAEEAPEEVICEAFESD